MLTGMRNIEAKGFTMRDIQRLEDRVDDLEEATALSLLEVDVQNFSVFDSSGTDRTKSGFVVDNFIDLIKSKSNEQDVKVANFGTFTNKVTPQRLGRNPKTGEEHIITERVKLNFIASNKVKDQLN